MKKLQILYFANFDNPNSDNTEGHIRDAFEQLGHKVISLHEKDYGNILDYKPDLFLFHKAAIDKYIDLRQFIKLLNYVTCTKVCWYFDKIIGDRERFIESIANYTDYVFMTDDTWVRRHKYNNISCLRQGIGKKYTGISGNYKYDIAFTGHMYSPERQEFVSMLKSYYGDRFRVFTDVFNKDLAELCMSTKVMIAPPTPCNQFYWSSRFYLTLGSGGFLVHPDLYGLKEEFTEGKHFAGYKTIPEIMPTVDYFLEHEKEREAIQLQGYKKCWEIATYKHRVEQMLNTIYGT